MNFLGCRAVAAVAMLCISLPALAQVPASQLPGVERQRFEELPPPRAQPGGAVIKLPSTVAPPRRIAWREGRLGSSRNSPDRLSGTSFFIRS